jgi:hypothetical protein
MHASVLHAAFARVEKPNKTRSAIDKATGARAAGNLIIHSLIIKLPLIVALGRPV